MMPGRKRGGPHRGYWFRTGCGWYITLSGGESVPLCDTEGKHIRDRHAPQDLLRQSYAYGLVHRGNGPKLPHKEDFTTVDICRCFLAHLKQSATPEGFKMWAQMLADMAQTPPRFPVTLCLGVLPQGAQVLANSPVNETLVSS